jgi:hypothetical protein
MGGGMTLLLSLALPFSAKSAIYETGAGSRTCAQFAQDYGANPSYEAAYFAWAQGWLAGLNSAETMVHGRKRVLIDLSSMPLDEQMLIVRQYCNDHPLADYAQAVALLRNRLTAVTLPPLPLETR